LAIIFGKESAPRSTGVTWSYEVFWPFVSPDADLSRAGSCWDHDGPTSTRLAVTIRHAAPNTRPGRFVALVVIGILLRLRESWMLPALLGSRAGIGAARISRPMTAARRNRDGFRSRQCTARTATCPGVDTDRSGSTPIGVAPTRVRAVPLAQPGAEV